MRSAADTIILPMQDLLSLGAEARMNQPATRKGNWEWRLKPEMLTSEVFKELGEMTNVRESPMSDRANDPVRHDLTLLTDDDLFLFNEGTHFRLYEKMLGAHEVKRAGIRNLFCRLGSRCRRGFRDGGFQRLGQNLLCPAIPGAFRNLGRVDSRGDQRSFLQIFHPVPLPGLSGG